MCLGGRRRSLLFEGRLARKPARNFLKLEIGVANFEDAIAAQQSVSLSYDINIFTIGNKRAARRADRESAIAKIFEVRGQLRFRRLLLGVLRFLHFRGRGGNDQTEGVAAAAFVLGLLRALQFGPANLRVLHRQDLDFLDGPGRLHGGGMLAPFETPNDPSNHQQHHQEEHLLTLFHAAFRKYVLTWSPKRMAPVPASFRESLASANPSTT